MRTIRLPDGMTRERVATLALIEENGPVSITDLAEFAKVRVPTMSRMAASLVEGGLARRMISKSDGRGVLVSLTPKGKRAIRRAHQESLKHLERALGKVSENEARALTRLAAAMDSLRDETRA